jgi:hypothetical protein
MISASRSASLGGALVGREIKKTAGNRFVRNVV